MRAAYYTATGGSDVLCVGEVETPAPGPGEVLVRIALAGVNPTDWKSRAGASGTEVPYPFQVPGQDAAGVVEAVGDGVDGRRIGERVWVYFAAWRRQWGTAAEYTVVPAEQAVPLGHAGDEIGASLGIPALTAYHCLFADGPIDGRDVLVAGGAGAVGHAAIELAVWAGARVIATVSSEEKAALARAAGADHVVNYRDPEAEEAIRAASFGGVERIVEVDLARNAGLDVAVAAPHAVISSYAAAPRDEAVLPVRQLMTGNVLLRFVLVYTIAPAALAAAVEGVGEALAAGALTALPVHRFALEDAAAAHDAVEGGAVGKVVIAP